MNSSIERLLSLRIKDVMNDDVLVVSESDSMQSAAKDIYDAEVTGAPVVDADGKCVGVLSASDFVGRDAGRHNLEMVIEGGPQPPPRIENLHDDRVATHMSPLVQTVSSEAAILQAARLMVEEGIHRLIVVDDETRPVGIVSTLDLVATLVAAVEE